MTALQAFHEEFRRLGYFDEAIVRDFVFSDVLASDTARRTVPLVAFTQTPPSYRSAAIAVVRADVREPERPVAEVRALGAPIVFSLSERSVGIWKSGAQAVRQLDAVGLERLPSLFSAHASDWSPESIHRAKAFGLLGRPYQLDFVDIGLLPAIEGEIHAKLDRLLTELVRDVRAATGRRHSALGTRTLFQAIFRQLAAKVLYDRSSSVSRSWALDDALSILASISDLYRLPRLEIPDSAIEPLAAAWNRLRDSLSFSNISSEDLAFVYENTLVTTESRRRFGTHSTPRPLAEFILGRIDLNRIPRDEISVYEPFTGAGAFLVSALRHLRDVLPRDWSARERHRFLVQSLHGSEIDVFASEVAQLSLILADYPNTNGWRISNEDLFEGDRLRRRLKASTVVLCNPPFEDFSPGERVGHAGALGRPVHKPAFVLSEALEAKASAMGFVLPRKFILERQYDELRRRIEERYEEIEIASLPDRVFHHSSVESALLIAQGPRGVRSETTRLRSVTVRDADRTPFLRGEWIPTARERTKVYRRPADGNLWIRDLDELWSYLEGNPSLGDRVEIHRGLEWTYDQSQASSGTKRPGFRRGVDRRDAISQFVVRDSTFLDCRERTARTGAIYRPWDRPKVLVNSIRLGRGPWRIAAVPDETGRVASQQFFGVWPRDRELDLALLAALLNGPLANAFLAVHSPEKGIRIRTLKRLPLPHRLEAHATRELVAEYRRRLRRSSPGHAKDDLARLLVRIDASVLELYDLPPRLEGRLLEYFRGYRRPVSHPFVEWLPEDLSAFVPLHEHVASPEVGPSWLLRTVRPLPQDEAQALAEFID